MTQMTAKHPAHSDSETLTVALDAFSNLSADVDLALRIAANLRLRVRGVFIEEPSLLQAAALPCTSEIMTNSGTERDLSAARLQQSLRSTAQRIETYLATHAQQLGLAWSYEVIQGERLGLLQTPLSESRLLMFFGRVHHRPFPRRSAGALRDILLINGDSARLPQVIEALTPISGSHRLRINVLEKMPARELHAVLTPLSRLPSIDIDATPEPLKTHYDLILTTAPKKQDDWRKLLDMARGPVMVLP